MARKDSTYWQENLRILRILMTIWFIVSFLLAIVFADALNEFRIGGFRLGFWFAQQGSIYVFLLLILFYVLRINALDRRFGVHESEDSEAES